ncbi:MAG TPA: aldo/keto reductase [Euzebya sp.]|nr:aldo/keto reductase [Euzebya sp.]
MEHTGFAGTGRDVSRIGLGCWQLGGDWGEVGDDTASAILREAVDCGITFFDTADVYGDGRSERLIGAFLRQLEADGGQAPFVATKVGRRNFPGPYTREILRQHITDSRDRLGVDTLDLVQLHCIPTQVMADGEVFTWLTELREEGLIAAFGASIESVEEAMMILDTPGLASLQIILNIFRQKPLTAVLDAAAQRQVAIIARVPLASGLLSGRFDATTTFSTDDHRTYNADGAAFSVGETFGGVPFQHGVAVIEEIRPLVPPNMTMAQMAQRWLLDQPAVTTVITGASRAAQVRDNAAAADLPSLDGRLHEELSQLYRSRIHDHIRGVY